MGRPAIIIALILMTLSAPLQSPTALQRLHTRSLPGPGNLPLEFESIAGPTGETAGFLARGAGRSHVLTPESIETLVPLGKIRMRFAGAARDARLIGADLVAHKTNYLIGKDPSAWRTGVTNFARVKTSGLYPGIEIQYRGSERELEFDLLVAPHADPSAVRLALEGVDHAQLGREGELRLQFGNREMILRKPRAFQQEAGPCREVSVEYALDEQNGVRFIIGGYDPSLPLTVDPVISYSTHLGGGGEIGRAIIADDFGNVYVAGETPSVQFPTKNPFQPASGGMADAFVTKISADGSGLIYSTYIGGSGDDRAQAIAVDAWGNAYITGSTRSSDFPVRNALQSRLSGSSSSDAFIAKLSPDGSALLYSTYLGGNNDDTGNGIAVDPNGVACIVGTTLSTNFPVRQALQWASGGLSDVVVAALSSDGAQLLFSTYLGGKNSDYGRGIALDGSGNACITGVTSSTDFPITNALQRTITGASSPFVAKLNFLSPGFVYSTYLGSGEGNAIAADRFGYVYVTGQTNATTFPTVNPAQSFYGGGGGDAFVSKLDPGGGSLVYSTYLGGQNVDAGYGIAVDAAGSVYVTGSTSSFNFPARYPVQLYLKGTEDAFVTELDASGSNLVFSTCFGGFGSDRGLGITVDRAGNICFTGNTYSFDFPTTSALKPNLTGFLDAFVVKLAPDTPLRQFLYFPQVAVGGGFSTVFTLTNTGATTASGTLALTDKTGKQLNALWSVSAAKSQGSSLSISVAAGATSILTAAATNASGAQQTGWAFLDTTGGRLAGMATFRLMDGSALKSIAGVLASQPTEYATIPVNNDDTQLRFTGFAIANPGNVRVNVKIETLDEKGKLIDSFFPADLNPLAPGGQVAKFLHELLPARVKFRGSMTLLAQSGQRIVVVALVQDRGLFTAIPVILARPPGL